MKRDQVSQTYQHLSSTFTNFHHLHIHVVYVSLEVSPKPASKEQQGPRARFIVNTASSSFNAALVVTSSPATARGPAVPPRPPELYVTMGSDRRAVGRREDGADRGTGPEHSATVLFTRPDFVA